MWLPLLGTGWADRAAACSYIGDNKTLGIEMVEWKNLQVQIPIPSSGRQATDRQFLRGRGWPLMHLQYAENCNSKFCPKTPQPRKESSPFPPTLPAPARNQVPGDQLSPEMFAALTITAVKTGWTEMRPTLIPGTTRRRFPGLVDKHHGRPRSHHGGPSPHPLHRVATFSQRGGRTKAPHNLPSSPGNHR